MVFLEVKNTISENKWKNLPDGLASRPQAAEDGIGDPENTPITIIRSDTPTGK